MPSGLKRPVNLRFGSQRIALGYIIDMPDGTTILAPDVPGLGFHVSIHPSGIVTVKDNRGFDQRVDFRPQALERNAIKEMITWVEELVASMRHGPELDEDLFAFRNTSNLEKSVFRRSRYGMDIDVLGPLRSRGIELPFFQIDQDAVSQYLETHRKEKLFLFAPKSKRIAFVKQSSRILSFEFDAQKLWDLVQNMPLGTEIVETFQTSIGYLTELQRDEETSLESHLESKFQSLDKDLLLEEASNLVSFESVPLFRRYTKAGFEPITIED